MACEDHEQWSALFDKTLEYSNAGNSGMVRGSALEVSLAMETVKDWAAAPGASLESVLANVRERELARGGRGCPVYRAVAVMYFATRDAEL